MKQDHKYEIQLVADGFEQIRPGTNVELIMSRMKL